MPIVAPLAAAATALALVVPATAAVAAPRPAPAAVPGLPPLAVLAAATTVDRGTAGIEHVDLLAADSARSLSGGTVVAGAVTADTAEDGSVLTRELPTDGAAVVGLSLDPVSAVAPTARIRFRTVSGWQPWSDVDLEDAAVGEETGGTPAAVGSLTSDGMVAAGAAAVQVQLDGLAEAPVTAAELLLVDAGPEAAGTSPTAPLAAAPAAPASAGLTAAAPSANSTAATLNAAVQPSVIGRAQWGASEAIPYADCITPAYGTRLDNVVVHHTAGTNAYSAADSAAILRGIQRYHVEGRGWCDVGYNVVVDKFGRVFEGRRGGLEELVVGVHASGFNTNAFGISVLGDYTQAAPTAAAVDALVRVIGWKSYLHGIDPAGTVVKDGVLRDRVIGHREVAQTACPGAFQGLLDDIALRARAVMLSYQPTLTHGTTRSGTLFTGPAAAGARVPVPASWTMTLTDVATGAPAARFSGDVTRRTDVLQQWDGALGSTGAFAEPGTYRVTMSARSTNGKDFGAEVGTVTLGYPAGFVAAAVPSVVTMPAGGGGSSTVRLADHGLPRASAVVLRVCSADASLTLGATDGSPAHALRTGDLPGGCGLVLVGAGSAGAVEVRRTGGSGAVRVDVVGYLPAAGARFWDVPTDSPFTADIGWIAGSGITTGYADGSFRPSSVVSRQAMAAFLHRSAGAGGFTPPRTPSFVDVPTDHPFYREIEWMHANGIATGTAVGGGRAAFKPTDPVSRQATAAFLHRLQGSPSAGGQAFTDVPATSPFASAIAWLAGSGITRGYDDRTFRPTHSVTRQAMAAFLHRADAVVHG